MSLYEITCPYTGPVRVNRRITAARHVERLVYNMIQGKALLDRPAGVKAYERGQEVIAMLRAAAPAPGQSFEIPLAGSSVTVHRLR